MSSKLEAPAESELLMNDLGPLAWVLEELRKSLDFSGKALRRFARETELTRGAALTDADATQLRLVRQHFHQASGALEMIGLPIPANVLHAMEVVAEKFVQRPELCVEAPAVVMEQAGLALIEYLDCILKGRQASSVALFPQYRAVQELAGAERIHPADLWPGAWRWMPVTLPVSVAPLPYVPDVRSHMDRGVLNVVKTGDQKSAMLLARICLGLAGAQSEMKPHTFWALAAGFFEAVGNGLLPTDAYTRRMPSRVLQQYAAFAKGEAAPSDRLAQDLAFCCWQALAAPDEGTHLLQAVWQAYRFAPHKKVNYDVAQFGLYDPAQLALARKRISAAAETWSALAGGDVNRLKNVGEQFNAVAESIVKMHPDSQGLAQALQTTIEGLVRAGTAPSTEIAMEVATAVLYLEASYEDLDPTDSHLAERGARLAQRMQHVRSGGEPEPLEVWMEDLYRRVSERQTMGSVVDELRASLADVEKSLDQFFRDTSDKAALRDVPSRLAQMRGVFSVLGMDQPSLAVLRMRSSVEQFLVDGSVSGTARDGLFEKIGNSLGAMSLLIDMLSYQRALAKKLFVYDEALGELKPLMGRDRATHPATASAGAPVVEPAQKATPSSLAVPGPSPAAVPKPTAAPSAVAASKPVTAPAPASAPAPGATPSPVAARSPAAAPASVSPPLSAPKAAVAASDDEEDGDLRDIFLDEARDVVRNGLGAARELASDPGNLAEQTTLRRAFHTLKGSSRMVGLNDFGEAAWSFEQLLNAWLADQKPASDDLIMLSSQAMQAFGSWIEDIANQHDSGWSAANFRASSDAMRLHGKTLPLRLPSGVAALVAPPAIVAHAPVVVAVPPASPVSSVAVDVVPEAPEVQQDFESTHAALPASAEPHLDPLDFDDTHAMELTYPEPGTPQPDFEPTRIGDVSLATDADELPMRKVQHDVAPEGGLNLDSLDFSVPVSPPRLTEQDDETRPVPITLDFPEMSFGTGGADAAPGEPMAQEEEPVKVIGALRLSIPFYNVYLTEADEWSRRLQTELSEWGMELPRPVSDVAISLAHSLAGSSATVGFASLANEARLLEHALGHLKLHEQGDALHAEVFNNSAEDIRRLLHQFAAGFLKEADPRVLGDLQTIIDTEFPLTDEEHFTVGVSPVPAARLASAVIPKPVPRPQAPVAPRPPVASPSAAHGDHEGELDAQDRLDPDLFPFFQEEALELMPALGVALRQWVEQPDSTRARADVLRSLHTLKGSARLAGAMRLGEMAHRMESGIEELGSEGLKTAQLEPMLSRFDALQATLDALSGPQSAAVQLPVEATVAAPAGMPSDRVAQPVKSAVTMPTATPPRTVSSQSVRVRSQLLDRLVNQAGEVMISRSSMESQVSEMVSSLGELRGNLDRLRGHLRDIELQAESQMQSRLALTKDNAQTFDPLEFDRFTRMQELTRMMAESVNDVATVQRNLTRVVESTEDALVAQGRQARELQRDLLRTRMVEFEAVSDRLYGVVRQAAKESSKLVRLDIVGGSFEMDRGVLDRMTPAFEHILRNAVAHGIEDAEGRAAAGKPASGTIVINVHQEGNDVSVSFADDGGGLKIEKIRAKAIASKLIEPDAVLTDAAAANLLFMPGFSTADRVTELSGRGIGMDVVLSDLNALGGRVETTTQMGRGTKFQLILPLTTAVTQVVILRLGNFVMGVPSNLMEVVLRVPQAKVEQAYQRGTFLQGDDPLPFFWAGALLQVSSRSQETTGKNLPVAVFRSAGQRIVMHVDEVLGNREVVVKNLGPQLSRLPGLAGMSVLASGAVVLIYNPVALYAVYGEQARALQSASGVSAAVVAGAVAEAVVEQTPLVLVVDDSITVRRVTQRLLKREGYRVALANDGVHALEKLREEKPAVVLSDIEMPRMDGFDLVRSIRSDMNLKDLPVIMITSRIAQKHRDLAVELGVDHYLGKPFSEEALLGLIRGYCADVTAQ